MRLLRNITAALALLIAPFVIPAIDTFAELRREKARRRQNGYLIGEHPVPPYVPWYLPEDSGTIESRHGQLNQVAPKIA